MATQTPDKNLQMGDPRLVVRWARQYAKSRTISFLVQWVFIVTIVIVVGIAASLTNTAYRDHNMVLFTVSVATMFVTTLLLTWFSVSRWGGELVWRITQWLYGAEGYVAYTGEHGDKPMPWWITALGGGLVIYHLVGAILVSFNYLSFRYMQPYSALYMAPFLCIMIRYQQLGFWAWLWPLLYSLHAILYLSGAPLGFTGQWMLLNLIAPVFGYGLLAILVGHAYSRFALWKLKSVTRSALPDLPDIEVDDVSIGDGGEDV